MLSLYSIYSSIEFPLQNENVMYLKKVDGRFPLLKFSYCLDRDIKSKPFTKCQEAVEFDLLFAAVKENIAAAAYDIDGYVEELDVKNESAMSREEFATFSSLIG